MVLWTSVFGAYPTRFCDSPELAVNSQAEKPTTNGFESGHLKLSRVHSCCSYSNLDRTKLCGEVSMQPSKSDGNLVAIAKEQKDIIHDCVQRTPLNYTDSRLSTAFCSACRKDIAITNGESLTAGRDEDSDSTGELCSNIDNTSSVISPDNSTSDISDSMTSSTATVILSCSELQDDNGQGTCISESDEAVVDGVACKTDNGPTKEPPQKLDDVPGKLTDIRPCDTTGENDVPGELTDIKPCDNTGENLTECDMTFKNSPCGYEVRSTGQCNSNSVENTSEHNKTTNSITLKPSSSSLFSKYLDIDGLTLVTDVVQERLRQIYTAHQNCVDLLHGQLVEERRRGCCGHNSGLGSPYRTSDLADEIVSTILSSLAIISFDSTFSTIVNTISIIII